MKRFFKGRFEAWLKRRQGLDQLPVTIHRRRLYILPTKAGVSFGVLLLIMLVAGLNYANSLALALTFLLIGFGLVVMHQCHRNLLGVSLEGASPQAAFAGESAHLALRLANPARLPRHQIEANVPDGQRMAVELPGRSGGDIELSFPAARRGLIRVDRVRISTSHPFGLFRAWAWMHFPLSVTVYPRPQGLLPLPKDGGNRSGERSRVGSGTEEWVGLRDFRDGDSPRQVAWKAYARGAPLLVKEYSSAGSDLRVFDFAALATLDLEPRLEQLARWVVDAEARGERYALLLPKLRIDPDHGPEHRHRCLSALAVYGIESPA